MLQLHKIKPENSDARHSTSPVLHVACFTLILLLCVGSYVSAAVLAPDGRAYRQIVLSDGQPNSVQLAARELQSFLAQITGEEPLPIVAEPNKSPVIYVGANETLKKQGLDGDKLPSEGWAVRTTGDFLAIYGQDYAGPPLFGDINPWRTVEAYNAELKLSAFGASGTLTAVYEFLHRVAGVRFYMPGAAGTVVPPRREFRVPELNLSSAPRVGWRWAWISFLSKNVEEALWAKRVGFGGKAPVMINHSYRRMKKYKDEHPEYFALADGKRAFGSECVANGEGHLCLTNPGLIQQWADDICDYFDKNPEVEIYPLSPEDGLNRICECPDCHAELRLDMPPEGRYSYHIWTFTAKVAKKVAERHPDKYVGCIAYEHYRMPPPELSRMPNVAVMYCISRSSLSNPKIRETVHRALLDWDSRVDRLYLWSYYLDHWLPWSGLPVFQPRNIHRELSWLYANTHFCGEFLNTNAQYPKDYHHIAPPGMQHFGLYLTGRLYLDPETDADALLAEYCRLFYGPAESSMAAFWNEAQDARETLLATKESILPDELFTPVFIKRLSKYLEQAVAATPEDSVYRRRVKLVKDEFDKGAARLIRLEAKGKRTMTLPIIQGFGDLDTAEGDRFTSKEGEAVSPATWLVAGRDRQFLYLRFICYEPDMTRLREDTRENDKGSIWMDDAVEIHLFPDENNLKHGFQIIVNTAGFVYDSSVVSANVGDTGWQSGMEVRITKEKGRWLADLRLPFANIEIIDPNFTGDILANFYRNRTREQGTESSCWSPTGLSYHVCPEKFGVIHP